MPIKLIHGLLLFLFLNFSPATTAQQINPLPPRPSPPLPPGNYTYGPKFNPQMAIIMIALVSAFFFMGFFSVYIRQCAERGRIRGGEFDQNFFGGSNTRSRRTARGIDAQVIESFPTFKYSAVKNFKIGEASLECAVCLNEFEDDETLRLIPKCSHVFHPDCIDSWLDSHCTCPICRADLEPKPGEVFTIPVFEPDNNPGQKQEESGLIGPSDSTTERRPPRTISNGFRFTGLTPRSHSTGHSLIRPGENCARFTLILPVEVRNQILNSGLNRAKSCVAFPRARSTRSGFRSGSGNSNFNYERFNREEKPDSWGFSITPPFISRSTSVHRSEEPGLIQPVNSPKSNKSPLFLGMDNVGEKSSDRLRPDDQV